MMPLEFTVVSERVANVPAKVFRENGRRNYYVRLFLRSREPSDLDNVKFVLYELHPTFMDPKRISEDRRSDFELRIWTWGFFNVNCKVFLKDGSTRALNHFIQYSTD